ncbi:MULTISPECIES: restriction endonuclease subunit S [unclassified Psychrobacter]|uniref:restriction endonuclease subunit S n=1 Tax=unclassified Psychrobacter TaxID=196806 RepID=UPI0025DADDE7|nr:MULTISPECIES: restriction endonuclease subunit S [unclassified Psychrobacter]
MAKYQQYDEYKDSEVGLLGRIPLGWKVLRYKNILKIMQGMAFKSSEYVDSSSVVNIRMGNIKKGGHIDLKHNTKYLPEKYKDIYSEYRLYEGDAIIAMTDMSPSLDFLAVPAILEGLDVNTVYLLNQRVGKLILDKEFDIRFIRYWLLSDELRRQLKAKGLGTVQANMSNDDLYGAYFLCPSLNERVKIVNFLDHETAQIDTLINKQQTLIQLLKEKRQAVISHAVTKGLNPDAPMKDSGVEWLGEVPEHWDIVKLKWKASTTSGGTPTTSKYEDYYEDGDIPWIRTTDLNNDKLNETPIMITPKAVRDSACSLLPKDSVLIAMYGGAGSIGKHSLLNFESTINQAVCGVLPSEAFVPDYLHRFYEFYRPFWMIGAAGTRKDPNIGQDNIKEARVPIPPLSEQHQIADYLDKMQSHFDALTESAEKGIQLMQERRTALISAAVTGKIDVRGWQAPE